MSDITLKNLLRVACQYLKKAKNKFGNWTLAAAAFNRGIHGIEKELLRQKVKSYYDLLLNEETSRYVFRILAVKIIMSNPKNMDIFLNNLICMNSHPLR